MKKKWILAGILASSLAVATACGNSDTTSSSDENKGANISSKISETGVMNKEIAKTLESAKTEVVYENKEPNISLDQKGFKFNVERYQVVHVTNVDKGETYFDGETEGYIVTVKAKVNNQSDGKAYFSVPNMQGVDKSDTYLNRHSFVYDTMLVPPIKSHTHEIPYYKKGAKQTGLFEFYLKKKEYEELKNAHTKMIIPYASSDEEMNKPLGKNETIDFPLAKVDKAVQAKMDEKAAQAAPYEDGILDKNIAEKEVLSKKVLLNLTQKSEKVDVTVEGVEYSKLTPTESYKKEFTSFDGEDVVAASVKLKLKNNTDRVVTTSQMDMFLKNDHVKLLDQNTLGTHEGMLSPDQEGERYVVFLMKRNSDFETTEQFIFGITNITDSDGNDLLSKEVDFNLPTK